MRFIPVMVVIMAIISPCWAESELTGVIEMAKYPYSFLIDGTQTRFPLGGNIPTALPLGTRLWLKGEIKSELMPTSPSRSRETWRIHVEVDRYEIISSAFEKPKDAEQAGPAYPPQGVGSADP